MSDEGWRGFLAAEDLGDWVVLHGGATAVFALSSLRGAARLADAVAQVPGIDRDGVLLTVADDQLTVRLTRGVERLEPRHVGLARAISTVAHEHGAAADRSRAPAHWTLADRAGNHVCLCAWPDGATGPAPMALE